MKSLLFTRFCSEPFACNVEQPKERYRTIALQCVFILTFPTLIIGIIVEKTILLHSDFIARDVLQQQKDRADKIKVYWKNSCFHN